MNQNYFYIKEGKLTNPRVIKKAFELPDGSYELRITKKNKRSLSQNAFFHAILPDIQKGLNDAGYKDVKTTEDAKEVVKWLFLKKKVSSDVTGDEIITTRHTSDLTKEEMSLFLDEVIQWAAEYLGITIYSPNEQSAFQYGYSDSRLKETA